ncbi:MAG: hypothetical protein FJ297_16700 [Planctomycetes bacterium]|nr:hypothetical protein [Planctomycetota bacterium]
MNKDEKGKPAWVRMPKEEVPVETGLADARFDRKRNGPPKTYETPSEADSCWRKPGPKAGPFKAYPGDGGGVTYSWYRFADQPALLNADITDAEGTTLDRGGRGNRPLRPADSIRPDARMRFRAS